MKNRMIANFGLLAALTTASVCAADNSVQFDVPFQFHAGTKVMPPGRYYVSTLTDQAALVLACYECKKSMVVLTNGIWPSKMPETPTLQFQRYGEAYFLQKYMNGPSATGRELPKSKAELEFAKRSTPVHPRLVALKAH